MRKRFVCISSERRRNKEFTILYLRWKGGENTESKQSPYFLCSSSWEGRKRTPVLNEKSKGGDFNGTRKKLAASRVRSRCWVDCLGGGCSSAPGNPVAWIGAGLAAVVVYAVGEVVAGALPE
ncbi:MAG: hypothetical protein Q8R40_00315 [bacterium]|nr:hypothetical protein [bacterium]